MRASLQLSPVRESDLSPVSLARLRGELVGEAQALASQGAAHEALISELRGATDVDSLLELELAETGLARAKETLADIRHALLRLDGGTYGSCEACGLAMPFERLEAIPSARLCVACTGRRAGWPR
jgi:RNA polymerase-binding transcription factor DksA